MKFVGLKTDPKKTEAFRKMPEPKKYQPKTFLDMVHYLGKFIQKFINNF